MKQSWTRSATVRDITKAPKVNVIGLCAGGILSSMVMAHLSAPGQLDQIGSLGLGVTLLDMTEAGTTVSLMDEGTAAGPSSPPAPVATWTGARSPGCSPGSGRTT